MPIHPGRKKLYPPRKEWLRIRARILERAGHRCEGSPRFPNCRAANHQPHPVTGSKVVLTIAHLNHRPSDCRDSNLRAWCNRCHLVYDQAIHIRNRRQHVLAASREGESLTLPLEDR